MRQPAKSPQAQIFVATLGASNYTYACATERQTTADWIGAQVRALEFIGGVPRLIVPDQTRALIKYPDRYDPEPNRTYDEFATHYGCAVLAARPAHPRDKPKVEGSVLLVERWILARLRNRRFFSLGELNRPSRELLVDLNQRAFKKLPGCRASAFKELDAPALRPLPAARYEISRWKSAKVNIDYHVEFDGHYYSVPHALVGTVVELRVTASLVECFAAHQRVACHALSQRRGAHSTTAEHMPASHRAHLEWTPGKLIDWGRRIGVSAAAVVTWQLEHRPHPEQGYRACLGLQRLARQYTPAAAGGGLHPRSVDPLAHLPQRRLDPEERAGSPALAVCAGNTAAAGPRERARPRLLPLKKDRDHDAERTHPQPIARPAPGRHGARHRGADQQHRGQRAGVR